MTPEQTGLLQKAQESYEAAQLLTDKKYYDAAVSRAYYAMFYVAQLFLLNKGLRFAKHSAVIAAFGQHIAHAGDIPAEFHRYLIKAEDKRKISDYHFGYAADEAEAQGQLRKAQQFLQLTKDHFGSSSASS